MRPRDDLDWELYNMDNDTGETNNLARAMPDRVSSMTDLYEEWWKHVGGR